MNLIRRNSKSAVRDGGRQSGFTLIEVMFTVVIIGILSSIAIPQYSEYTRKSRRAEVQALLADIAIKEQGHLLSQRAYTATLGTLGITVPISVSANYTVAVTVDAAVSPPEFSASATPVGAQQEDKCGTLMITDAGVKSATQNAVSVTGCW